MKSRAVAALLLPLLAIPAQGWGSPCTKAYGVRRGSPAPCTGVLLPRAAALAGVRCRQVELPLSEAATLATVARCQADAELAAHRLRACEARDGIPIVQPSPWWRLPWLWGVVGLVAGGAAGRLTLGR